jgi:hypothetical protein
VTYLVEPPTSSPHGPLVHALIIGVGGYRHLPGGSEEVDHDTVVTRQLQSPPRSALAVARWVRDEMRHPQAALGSVDVLLSSPKPLEDLDAAGLELSDTNAVVTAVKRWKALCSSDPSNVAVFFFCGHGITLNSQLLLLEDFGGDPDRLLYSAVDLDQLVTGMRACRALTQYFFVDACQEIPPQLLGFLPGQTVPLLNAILTEDRREEWGVVSSTRLGHVAYGRQEHLTLFTEQVLAALRGQAAVERDGRWLVSFSALHEAVSTLTHRHSPKQGTPQFPDSRLSGMRPLHVLPGPPQVNAGVCCTPATATPQARVCIAPAHAADAPGGCSAPDPVLTDSWWRTPLTAGIHGVSLMFPEGEYAMTPPSPKLISFTPFDPDHTVGVRESR